MSGALLVVGVGATPVIAAPDGIDHPPGADASFLLDGLVVAAALAILIAFVRLGGRRLDAARPRTRLPGDMLLLFGFALFLAAPLGAGVVSMLTGTPDPTTLAGQTTLAAGAYGAQLAVLGIMVWQARRYPPASPGTSGTTPARAAGLGVAAMVVAWPVVSAAAGLVAWLLATLGQGPPPPIAHDTLALLVDAPRDGWFYAMSTMAVFAAPLVEEIMYRGAFQRALRHFGLGPWTAIVIVSVVFAAMHWSAASPHAVAGLFVLSLGFGWTLERTGQLLAPIAMHVAFNAANLVIALVAS